GAAVLGSGAVAAPTGDDVGANHRRAFADQTLSGVRSETARGPGHQEDLTVEPAGPERLRARGAGSRVHGVATIHGTGHEVPFIGVSAWSKRDTNARWSRSRWEACPNSAQAATSGTS